MFNGLIVTLLKKITKRKVDRWLKFNDFLY